MANIKLKDCEIERLSKEKHIYTNELKVDVVENLRLYMSDERFLDFKNITDEESRIDLDSFYEFIIMNQPNGYKINMFLVDFVNKIYNEFIKGDVFIVVKNKERVRKGRLTKRNDKLIVIENDSNQREVRLSEFIRGLDNKNYSW